MRFYYVSDKMIYEPAFKYAFTVSNVKQHAILLKEGDKIVGV